MNFWSAQEMLNFQCHCRVMQQEWAWAICGFCGFFLCLSANAWADSPRQLSVTWTLLSEYLHLNSSQSRNQGKKRLTKIASPALVSILPVTLGNRYGLLDLRDSEIQPPTEYKVSSEKIFKFLSGSCVRSGIAETYSVLLLQLMFTETFLRTQWKTQWCIKPSAVSPQSSQSNGEDTRPWEVIIHASLLH